MDFMRLRTTSSPILPVSWRKTEYATGLFTVAVCCAIALISDLQRPTSLAYDLITANAIGLSCWACTTLIRIPYRGRLPIWGLVLSIPLGTVIGAKLAGLTGAPDITASLLRDSGLARQSLLSIATVVAVVVVLFLYFSHSMSVREALEGERRRAAEALHAETAARLALLQAQIEPHFLFNTLANIHSLIQEDPERASVILEQLNAYLRTSLRRTRQPTSTLAEELELIEALLGIAVARLGHRLEYTIIAPEELRSYQLPPLLLQPLVENAIRHGIEPAIAGGSIRVAVSRMNDALELTVTDTGVGLNEEAPQGVGLANIRARLSSLYAGRGTLALYANMPHGVIARLLIPSAASQNPS
jgi:signal transduction histidine kinase